MKCPECGRLSMVVEKRGTIRRRRCTNGHRFKTDEAVVDPTIKSKKQVEVSARDREIAAMYRPGVITADQIAAMYGISDTRVRQIIYKSRVTVAKT